MNNEASMLKSAAPGEFYGTELTKLTMHHCEHHRERVLSTIKDGIGKVVKMLTPAGESVSGVLEDIDFETDPKNRRYIARTYDDNGKLIYVDSLFDWKWKIIPNLK